MSQSVSRGGEVQRATVTVALRLVLCVVVDVEIVSECGGLQNLEPAVDKVRDVESFRTGLLQHDRHVILLGLWDHYNRMDRLSQQ